LLDLANRAAEIFARQPATEQRKLLRFVVDQCRWKTGQLEFEYRKPFDLIAEFDQAETRKLKTSHSNRNGHGGSGAAGGPEGTEGQGVVPIQVLAGDGVQTAQKGQNDNWLPGMDSNHDSRLQRPLSYH
jgi:hypothetical protein